MVIIDLLNNGSVALAKRKDAIRPADSRRSSIRKALETAANHFEELWEFWEEIHGDQT